MEDESVRGLPPVPAPWPVRFAGFSGGRDSVCVGGGVIDHLIDGIERWLANEYGRLPGKIEATRSAIGCVYRLTDPAVVDTLIRVPQSCIVIGKQPTLAYEAHRLAREGGGAHTSTLPPNLFGLGRPDASGLAPSYDDVIGDNESESESGLLASLRVAGWQEVRRRTIPLVHAKVLVLGHYGYFETDYGTEGAWIAERVWIGSANWTFNARRSAEMGVWIADEDLARTLGSWIAGLIAMSEPHTSTSAEPSGDLMLADFPEPDLEDYPEPDWDEDDPSL